MLLKKRTMLYFFDETYMIFSRNIIKQVFLINQKLAMNMLQIFKTKYISNFRKHRSRKKFRFAGVKMEKSNIIEKTEELMTGYQETKCLWNVLCSSYRDKKLRQMALTNLSKRFDMSGKLL